MMSGSTKMPPHRTGSDTEMIADHLISHVFPIGQVDDCSLSHAELFHRRTNLRIRLGSMRDRVRGHTRFALSTPRLPTVKILHLISHSLEQVGPPVSHQLPVDVEGTEDSRRDNILCVIATSEDRRETDECRCVLGIDIPGTDRWCPVLGGFRFSHSPIRHRDPRLPLTGSSERLGIHDSGGPITVVVEFTSPVPPIPSVGVISPADSAVTWVQWAVLFSGCLAFGVGVLVGRTGFGPDLHGRPYSNT